MDSTLEQILVIDAEETRIAVNATAGSGKTMTLVERGKRLVHDGRRIAFLAFNKGAASELGSRFSRELGPDAVAADIRTLHSAAWMCANADMPVAAIGGRGGEMLQKEFNDLLFEKTKAAIPPAAGELSKKEWRALRSAILGLAQATVANDFSTVRDYVLEAGVQDEPAIANGAEDILDWMVKQRGTGFNSLDLGFRYAASALESGVLAPRFDGVTEVMVDEAQDLSPAQWRFIDALVSATGSTLTIVGDDDQCIYRWRFASLRGFLDRCEQYKLYTLSVNFRCPEDVVNAAAACVGNNTDRIDKEIEAHRKDRAEIKVSSVGGPKEEASLVVAAIRDGVEKGSRYKDFAVLSRTHSARAETELALVGRQIPFRVLGSNTWQSKEISCLLDWCRAIYRNSVPALQNVATELSGLGSRTIQNAAKGCSDVDQFAENLSRLARGRAGKDSAQKIAKALEVAGSYETIHEKAYFGAALLYPNSDGGNDDTGGAETPRNFAEAFLVLCKHVKNFGDLEEYVSLLQNPESGARRDGAVTLSTIHRVKGGEFNNVIMVHVTDGQYPHYRSQGEAAVEDERRLFYVGMTRSLGKLTLVCPEVDAYGKPAGRSPFIVEAGLTKPEEGSDSESTDAIGGEVLTGTVEGPE